MSDVQKEISKLAAMFEYGELMASTDPAEFIAEVCERITALERDLAAAREEIERRRAESELWMAMAESYDGQIDDRDMEIVTLRAALVDIVGEDDPKQLRSLRREIELVGTPADEKRAMLAAIDALLGTEEKP